MSRGSAKQEIKTRLNIADMVKRYVNLQRHGNRWIAPCPFHQETKPSFSVNEEEGFFHCFGCQASGDIFEFYGRINGLDFRETLEQLAEEAGVTLEQYKGRDTGDVSRTTHKRRVFLKMYEFAGNFYSRNLVGPDGEECRAYLAKRRLAPEIQESFGLGWSSRGWKGLADALRRSGFTLEDAVEAGLASASDKGAVYDRFRGRLMFPIRNLTGHAIAFGGRIIADEDAAKYINSADSLIYKKGDHVYGLFQARRSISAQKSAMLTEGYMDVLTLHQFGYTNACGVLGTALTPEQIKRLSGFCSMLELLFDGDGAGRKAALRGVEMALTRGLRCKVVLMPEGEDIDSLLHNAGRDAFEKLRASAPEGIDFCIRALSGVSPREALDWVKQFLRQVEQPEFLSGYVSKLARGLGLDESELRRNLPLSDARQAIALEVAKPKRGDDFEAKLLRYVVLNPEHLPELREHGAEIFLASPFAREIWSCIASCEPEYLPEDIIGKFAESTKIFWITTRTHGSSALTRDVDKKSQELREICDRLDFLCRERENKACLQAIRQTGSGNEYNEDLLKALQESVRRKHGKY